MSKFIKVTDIRYDTDGLKVKLPKTLIFEVDDDLDPDNEIADKVSEKTGWCVSSLSWEEIQNPN